MQSKSKNVLFKVASGDIPFANAKNCAQFFTLGPQSFGRSSLPAEHATVMTTSRLDFMCFKRLYVGAYLCMRPVLVNTKIYQDIKYI